MASPQKENGYTAIANEILEAIARITLSPTGYKILFVVWRQTYGFNRCQHSLSDTFIAKAINTTPALINREINRLIDRNILTLYKKGTFTSPRQIGFNKNYDLWDMGTIQSEGTVQTDTTIYSDEKGTIQIDKKVLPKQIVKKRHSKDSNKEKIYSLDSQEYILSQYLLDKMIHNNPTCKKPELNNWAIEMDKILRIDNRPPDEIRLIINYCQSDSFWKGNILSVGSLRKQYDKLNVQRITKDEKKTPFNPDGKRF